MVQRDVQRTRVDLVELVEHAIAPAIERAEHALALLAVIRRIEEARAQHRDDGDRDEQRHRQRERHDRGQRAEGDAAPRR